MESNTDDGGWTLVYKIADTSDMRGTEAINSNQLAQHGGNLSAGVSGKLSDVAIRSLCTEQYKVVQLGSSKGPLYCSFDDISQYGDNIAYTGKDCSLSYSSNGDYPDVPLWNPKNMDDIQAASGFSTWPSPGFTIPGATILQLSQFPQGQYGQHAGHKNGSVWNQGSPLCSECQTTDSGCGALAASKGGCHSQVWCRPEPEVAFGRGVTPGGDLQLFNCGVHHGFCVNDPSDSVAVMPPVSLHQTQTSTQLTTSCKKGFSLTNTRACPWPWNGPNNVCYDLPVATCAARPTVSCAAMLAKNPNAKSGTYTIQSDEGTKVERRCDRRLRLGEEGWEGKSDVDTSRDARDIWKHVVRRPMLSSAGPTPWLSSSV